MYLLNDRVVSKWDSLLVELAISPLVDQLSDTLQIGIPNNNQKYLVNENFFHMRSFRRNMFMVFEITHRSHRAQHVATC